jgi:hypothetical protein
MIHHKDPNSGRACRQHDDLGKYLDQLDILTTTFALECVPNLDCHDDPRK